MSPEDYAAIEARAEKIAAVWPALTPAQIDLIRTVLSEPAVATAVRQAS